MLRHSLAVGYNVVNLCLDVVNLQCRDIAVNSHNEMTKVATELHSVSICQFRFSPLNTEQNFVVTDSPCCEKDLNSLMNLSYYILMLYS